MNFRIIALTLLTFSFQAIYSQSPEGKDRLIDQVKAHKTGMAVWWTGHNGWLVKYNDILIGTDLALEDPDRAVTSPVTAAELAPELDVSFISHEHGDHFERETSRILAEKGDCLFVMPANCREIALNETGIPAGRIRVATPRVPFKIGEINVEPVRAIHGNPKFAVYYDANMEDCGYLITLGGKRLMQMGDTVLLEDHLYLKSVDVLFFSPTEHNTHIDPSVILINELEPDFILPQHRDTYKVTPENRYWTSGYPYEVKFRLSKELQQKYHILAMGEMIEIK